MVEVKTRSLSDARAPGWALVAIAAVALVLSACAGTTHEEEGAILGGVVGGVLGAQVGEGSGRTAAIIIGAIAGSMVGQHIGETMDEADRRSTAVALHNNRTGESTVWVNPDNGNRYVVTPTKTYESQSGPCREFRVDAKIGDRQDQEVIGTACLQADGSWVVR